MVELTRGGRMRVPVIGATALLAMVAFAGCGGSGTRSHGPSSGATTGSTSGPPGGTPRQGAGSLSLSPTHPTTSSEVTFTFTAPVASGVHGSHVISYSLSLVGPDRAGCVGAHEAGVPSVARGARAQIIVGPAELQAPWCAGSYLARLLELRRAHCTGSAPCPQYVNVVGLVGRATFTVRRG